MGEFNAHVADLWSQNGGCWSAIKSYLDPDVGNLNYYLCIKQFGYNCWVSIPTDANPGKLKRTNVTLPFL